MTVNQRVLNIIMDLFDVEGQEVTNETNFTTDLYADPTDFAELIMKFEEEFNIGIPDHDAENIETVADIIAFIHHNAPK